MHGDLPTVEVHRDAVRWTTEAGGIDPPGHERAAVGGPLRRRSAMAGPRALAHGFWRAPGAVRRPPPLRHARRSRWGRAAEPQAPP